ncbi:MAG TPA: PilZ domain-containing protein, partial [Thermodesulfobacteriota bacterium]|nr:PilZ domain-containing protein [Thermodesulfobacteriota bacterium]
RRFPRLLLDLPLEYRVLNGPYAHGGLTVNASEAGLRIQSIKNIPVGAKLFTLVLFPKGFELTSFEVLAEVIWKDLHREEDWEGFHYGLNIIEILEEDRKKLKQLLGGQSYPQEALRSSCSFLSDLSPHNGGEHPSNTEKSKNDKGHFDTR